MPHMENTGGKLTEQLSFRVSPRLYGTIELIAKKQRRKPNEVARALLERGVAAFYRDGVLFEDDPVGEFVEGIINDARALARQDEVAEVVHKRRSEAEMTEQDFKAGQVKVGTKKPDSRDTRRKPGTRKR